MYRCFDWGKRLNGPFVIQIMSKVCVDQHFQRQQHKQGLSFFPLAINHIRFKVQELYFTIRYMNLLILIFPLRCVTDCIVYCIASKFVNEFYILIFVVVNMKFLLNGSPVYGQINLFVRSKITKSNKMYGRRSISKSLIRIRSKKVWICNNGQI